MRGNTEQAKALKSSLRDLLKNDEELCKEYELLNTWLSVPEEEYVRVLQYIVSHGTNSTQPMNFNNAAKEEPAVSTINNNSGDLNDYEKINEPLALKSFKEVRNHNAHGITKPEDDDKLRRLSTLALEVTVCLKASEPLAEIKELNFELAEHLILTTKRKDEEDGELSDFALDIIDRFDSSIELKQIML
ncbi:11530_t:CDS:2 [Funneliformis mosseae]|uniref:11530_t:CDS:1 n=1 Tax=Funneliformis mosseae TaxID=27381 RepID=A0A9N9AWW2_FUNMO|nr:11530_t:CDS:2 [Funneliformis mosseae]